MDKNVIELIKKSEPISCGSCFFFYQQPGDDKSGACHRYPPALMMVKVKTFTGMVDAPAAMFPQVSPLWWCGEYHPRTKSPEKT